jgi:alkanesulfonate monooxygenase SsuD/methylene tetrahydromethanopterin reductase-like flavin-dependent oxidoreductase (luciferase family)
MRFGVVYPQIELGGDATGVRRIGRAVEDSGFDYLLAYDHVLGAVHADREPTLSGPYTERDPFHDPFVMFGYLADVTERIGFATGVLVLPQRQTALVARQAADVDLLSGGGCASVSVSAGITSSTKPRAGLPHPRGTRGRADRPAAAAVHRARRRLRGPLRPGESCCTGAEAVTLDPDLAREVLAKRYSTGRPASPAGSFSSAPGVSIRLSPRGLFRKAQADSRKGAEQAKKLLAARVS